jgi:hypothetical protein
MKDINTLTVADLTENAPPFTGWRLATEETISAWGQAMKYGDKDVLDLAKKVKHQLDMMVAAPAPRIADQSPHDRQAAYDYLNEKGVSHILVSHLVEFSKLQNSKQEPKSYAPAGWHLVPRLMSASMINAWSAGTTVTSDEVAYRTHFQDAWKRVLAATQTPDCKECSNTGYTPEGNHCMACSEPADPNIEELFSRQQAGFERCFEALGITDDRERSWSSLVLAINGALEGRKQDFEFEGWFDKEYPQDDEGRCPKYQETSVVTLMRHAFEAGRDLTSCTNRSAIVPLTEPVSIAKALLGGREAKVVTAVGGEVAAFLVNIQLTGWNNPKEHAEGYVRGFNLAAKWMQDAISQHKDSLTDAADPKGDYQGPNLTFDRLTRMRDFAAKQSCEGATTVKINTETLLCLIDTIQHHEYVPPVPYNSKERAWGASTWADLHTALEEVIRILANEVKHESQ